MEHAKDGYDASNSACFSVLATLLVAGNVEVPERWQPSQQLSLFLGPCDPAGCWQLKFPKDGNQASNSACFSVLATVLVADKVRMPENWLYCQQLSLFLGPCDPAGSWLR